MSEAPGGYPQVVEHQLPEAERIPEFSRPASSGQTLSLESFEGKVSLILVFLPDIDLPEAKLIGEELDDRHADFGKARCQVLMVTRRTAREVRGIADDTGWTVPILADPDGAMIRAYRIADDGPPVAVVADKAAKLHRHFDPLSAEHVGTLLTLARHLAPSKTEGPGP